MSFVSYNLENKFYSALRYMNALCGTNIIDEGTQTSACGVT